MQSYIIKLLRDFIAAHVTRRSRESFRYTRFFQTFNDTFKVKSSQVIFHIQFS